VVVGVAIFAYAAATRSATWNYIGLAVYSATASSAVCIAIIGLKVWTAVRMRALPAPESAWPRLT
jgi:hypothetical protein